jgi:hypothetical protein
MKYYKIGLEMKHEDSRVRYERLKEEKQININNYNIIIGFIEKEKSVNSLSFSFDDNFTSIKEKPKSSKKLNRINKPFSFSNLNHNHIEEKKINFDEITDLQIIQETEKEVESSSITNESKRAKLKTNNFNFDEFDSEEEEEEEVKDEYSFFNNEKKKEIKNEDLLKKISKININEKSIETELNQNLDLDFEFDLKKITKVKKNSYSSSMKLKTLNLQPQIVEVNENVDSFSFDDNFNLHNFLIN